MKKYIVICCTALLGYFFTECSESSESVMFLGNPQHTSVYNTAGIEQTPEIKWKFKTGGQVISTPAVAEGSVYFGSEDGYMYAVNVESGGIEWKYETHGKILSSPAVGSGIVVFGSFDGNYYALDAKTGEEVWIFETGGETYFGYIGLQANVPKDRMYYEPWDFFTSSPVIFNNTVYFGSGDHNIYAIDLKTGNEVWRYKTGHAVHSSPAVYNGRLYCGSWDSFLYALDLDTGEEIWKVNTGLDEEYHWMEGLQSSPSVLDGTVYIGTRSSYYLAVDAETGSEKWKIPAGGTWVCTSPALTGGKVYFGTSDSKLLIAFDCISGEEKFRFEAGAWIFSSAAVAGNTVYFGCINGRMYGLDVESGRKKWEFLTEGCRLDPEDVYTDDGKINRERFAKVEVNPEDTNPSRFEYKDLAISAGAIISSPVVDNGVIYFGSTDGNLYAIQ